MESGRLINQSLSDLVNKARPGTVRIQSGRRAFGAGTTWHPDGLIVTNAHVLGDNSPMVVFVDGSRASATILAADRHLDIAALMIERSGLPVIELGDSGRLKPGSIVIAMGFPWGVSDGATMGVVIGMNQAWGPGNRQGGKLIAASLHLRPGHSGGPMVDAAGRLVGINTMMNGPDVGVAIPVNDVKRFLKKVLPRMRATMVVA